MDAPSGGSRRCRPACVSRLVARRVDPPRCDPTDHEADRRRIAPPRRVCQGSKSTATRSASSPAVSDPTVSLMPSRCAAFDVAARSAAMGVTPRSTRRAISVGWWEPGPVSLPITMRTPRSSARPNDASSRASSACALATAHGGVTPLAMSSGRIASSRMRNVGTIGTSRSSRRSIASSSSTDPCSIERTPARTACLTARAPWACAIAPRMPASSASSKAARSSASVNCTASTESDADITPPLAMILSQSAPARIWSRAARRTASGPSAIPGRQVWRQRAVRVDTARRVAVPVAAGDRQRDHRNLEPRTREDALAEEIADARRRRRRRAPS